MAALRPLGETPRRERRPARVMDGDVLIYRDVVVGHLRQQSMPRHAALFACVNVLPDRLQWFTDLSGDIEKLAALPPDRAQAVMDQVNRLLVDIQRETARLAQDRNPNQRALADIIGAALHGTDPGSLRMRDVYIVGDYATLAWGLRDVADSVSDQELLASRVTPTPALAPRLEAPATPASSATMVAAATVVAEDAAPGGGAQVLVPVTAARWPLRLLSIAALLLLLAAASSWFLPRIASTAMAFHLPPAPACDVSPPDTALLDLQDEEAGLRAEIATLQADLDGRVLQCRIALAAREPPEAPTPPPPPPVPPPNADDDAMNQRLQREHAASSNTQVTLAWDGRTDLDLHVRCPDGTFIETRHDSCGGQLDVDMNFTDRFSDTPVENVVWPNGAPPGHYRVVIRNYTAENNARIGGPAGLKQPIAFRVRIIINGVKQAEVTGTAGVQGANPAAEFDVP